MAHMQIHAINDFAAPVETVFAMLTDRVFLRAVCLATDPLDHDVTVDGLQTSTRTILTICDAGELVSRRVQLASSSQGL